MLQFVVVWSLDRGPLFWETPQHDAASSLVRLGQRSPKCLSDAGFAHPKATCTSGPLQTSRPLNSAR